MPTGYLGNDRTRRVGFSYRPAFGLVAPPPPASNPSTDINATASLRSVNYMVNHRCQPISQISSHLAVQRPARKGATKDRLCWSEKIRALKALIQLGEERSRPSQRCPSDRAEPDGAEPAARLKDRRPSHSRRSFSSSRVVGLKQATKSRRMPFCRMLPIVMVRDRGDLPITPPTSLPVGEDDDEPEDPNVPSLPLDHCLVAGPCRRVSTAAVATRPPKNTG